MQRFTTLLMTLLSVSTFMQAQHVGIGTTTPNAPLDVAGDALINGLTLGRGPGDIDNNVVFGKYAFLDNQSGIENVAIGYSAQSLNTMGNYNVSVGAHALHINLSGALNTAIGYNALRNANDGFNNTGVGALALFQTNQGVRNTALGQAAGMHNINGIDNTFIGCAASSFSGNLTNATAIGANALVGASNSMVLGSIQGVNGATANTYVGIGTTTPGAMLDVAGDIQINELTIGRGAGNSVLNVAVGKQALHSNTSGYQNVAIGHLSIEDNTTGTWNTALGAFSLSNNTIGTSNTAIGDEALRHSISGQSNTGMGRIALLHNSTGSRNVAVGEGAGLLNIGGSDNTFIGWLSGPDSDNLTNASAIGSLATVTISNAMVLGSIQGVNGALSDTYVGIGTTAPDAMLDVAGDVLINGLRIGRGPANIESNIAFGKLSLNQPVNGVRNVAIGFQSLFSNIENYNVAVGTYTLLHNTWGYDNSAFGDAALQHNTTGRANVGVGKVSLYYTTTGIDNSALGHAAGVQNVAGSGNTFIGSGTEPSVGDLTNATAIGHRAFVSTSNALVLGSINGVNGATANTNVGIGTSSPTARLDVAGTFNASAWKTASVTANGFAEMGGVLIQWGTVAYNSNNTQTISFPKVFNTTFSVTATVDAGNNSGTGANVPVKVLNTGTSTFQIAGTQSFAGDNTSIVRWMAIGN